MNDLFRFIGEDNNTGYKKGQVYMLELIGRGMYSGVNIIAPAPVLYANWNTFLQNWERVN